MSLAGGAQQPASGRLGTFASSSSDLPGNTKKKSPPSSIQKGTISWRPTVFDFKSGANKVCPTCQGTGRIPKGQEEELVALIPYNDKRLKPRRTCLYMSILVGLLLACGGLLTAFLYPRNVDVTILAVNSTEDYVDLGIVSNVVDFFDDSDDVALLAVKTTIKIQNSNFFPVWVSSLNVTLSDAQNELGEIATHSFSVKSRASQSVTVVQNATYNNGPARRAMTVCTSSNWQKHYLYIEAMVVLRYTYLSHVSDAITSDLHKVDCAALHWSIPSQTVGPPHISTIAPNSDSLSHSQWL